MKTAFSKESPVGRLFEEIKRITQAKHIPIQKLEEEIDVGYVEDPFYTHRILNEKGILSEGEVLEYVYRFKDYYPYLHKHGFPVPFSMDDFDSKTKEDENIRREIYEAVEGMKKPLMAKGLDPATDEYKLALARVIYEWCLKKMEFFSTKEKKLKERAALEAYIDHEGECTERNSILFYVLKVAGLEPMFFGVGNPLEPTLDNYFLWRRDHQLEGHVFVGIFLNKSRRHVNLDVSLEKFDSPYQDAYPLTPRQFVSIAFLENKRNIAIRNKGNDSEYKAIVTNFCRVAPLGITCLEESFKKGGSDSYQKLRSLYPYLVPWSSYFEEVKKAQEGRSDKSPLSNFKKLVEDLDKLSTSYPVFVDTQFKILADGILQYIKKRKSEDQDYKQSPEFFVRVKMGMEVTKKAILIDSNDFFCFWVLEQFYVANPARQTAYDLMKLFDDIATVYPDISLAHYFSASFGLEAASYQKLSPTDMEMVERHITRLFELEPNHLATTRVHVETLFQKKRFEEIAAYLEPKIKNGEPLEFILWHHLFVAYQNMAQWRRAVKTEDVEEVIAKIPDYFRRKAVLILPDIYMELILQAILQGDFKKAKEFYERIEKFDADFLGNDNYKQRVLVPLFSPLMEGHQEEKELDNALQGLELVYPDFDECSSTLKKALLKGYSVLKGKYHALSNSDKVDFIERRLTLLQTRMD